MKQSAVMRETHRMWMATGVFALVTALIVAVNSMISGWHLEYSISRYVGLQTWSAILFALSNFVVIGLVGKYLYAVGEHWRLKRWFYYVIVLMMVAFVGVSMCPLGYFDRFVAGKSVVSVIHELCSRGLFVCMAVLALGLFLCRQIDQKTRILCAVFVLYGIVCAIAYFRRSGWLTQAMLVFESCYIVGFMMLCCGFREKTKQERS